MKLASSNKLDIKYKFCPEDYEMSLITDIINDYFFVTGFKCERICGEFNLDTQIIIALAYTESYQHDIAIFQKQVSGEYYVKQVELISAYDSGFHDRCIYHALSVYIEICNGNVFFDSDDFYSDDELIKEYGEL